MSEPPIASVVFTFEEVSPTLDLLPVAARRALDHSGLRLSLDGWRSLSLDDRRNLTLAGGDDLVDAGRVVGIAARSNPLPQAIEAVGDPDALTPPVALQRSLEPARGLDSRIWVRLRALDRYALMHAHRRAVARDDPSRLVVAFDAIVRISPPQPRRSSMPPPHVRHPSAPPPADAPSVESRPPSSLPPAPLRPMAVHAVPTLTAPPAPVPSSPPPAPEAPLLSTHLTQSGDARMVDVAIKASTARRAVAFGSVKMRRETIARVSRNDTPKGDVLAAARIAGIMAAKRTPDLVPLCHVVALTSVTVHIDIDTPSNRVNITAVAEAFDRTGVEMEALTAVTVACLTLYDMLKGIDREMVIADVKLLEKSGGRTGHYRREAP